MQLQKPLVLLLVALASAAAMDMDMHMGHESATAPVDMATVTPVAHEGGHHHGMPILQMDLTPAERMYWEAYNTTTYLTVETPYKRNLIIHVALILITNVFLYPIVLVLNNLGSNWFLPGLTVHVLLTFVSLLNYWIFIGNVPDLYPNNAYSHMSVILFFMTGFHFVVSIIHYATKWVSETSRGRSQFIPLEDYNYQGSLSPSTLYDDNSDSGSFNLEDPEDVPGIKQQQQQPLGDKPVSKLTQLRDKYLGRIMGFRLVENSVRMFGHISFVLFNIFNYGLFVYFLVYLPTGIACLNLMGQEKRVFNLLAHFIKGGVFFLLGIVSLARYCGAFSKLGMAWNFSYITRYEKSDSLWYRIQPAGDMITMEMIESSLILFYGSTNIFLEHLAAWGQAWTAKDFQHASIAFMYIGAGLCGVLCERRLANWRRSKFNALCQANNVDTSDLVHGTPGYSPNPFPVFTIFWTGLLMSQHAQASQLSTSIHVQWGNLLTYGSFFRLFTHIMMNFAHHYKGTLFNPARPFTELITSFALICGGLVFMESTDQVVEAMEYRGLTSMFTLNVSVGVVALIMGWIMAVFSFKDWLKAKNSA